MKWSFNNKNLINTFKVLSLVFLAASIIMMLAAVIMNMHFITTQYSFFPGLILTNISLLLVLAFILSNNIKNVSFFKKYKWTIWIISISASILLGFSMYHVFYRLMYTAFPQAIGLDHGAFWSQNEPFVYLSIVAIVLNIFASFITIFVKEKS